MRAAWISGAAIVAVAGAFVAGRASTTHTPAAAQAAVRPAPPPRAVKADDNDAASDAAAASPDAAADATVAAEAAMDVACADGARNGDLNKDQFRECVQGKTMEQVRKAYGSPFNVSTDIYGATSWYYPHAPVYDSGAGIQIAASVDFGPSGTATGAHY